MEKYNIDDYDLFIFDFDGTIMNTEPYHYSTYLKAIKEYNNEINLTQNEYFKLVHDLDRTNFEKLFKNFKSEVYKKKSDYYCEIVKDENICIDYIGNIDKFIEKIKKKNKKAIIVTNSSILSINILKNIYPLLNQFDEIYTKEDFNNKKPNPECYLKIAEIYKNTRMIGFEDSNPGVHALTCVKDIKPIHIKSPNYYYNDIIKQKYKINVIDNYDCFE